MALISLSIFKQFIDTVNISAEPDTVIHQADIYVKSLSATCYHSKNNLDPREYPG